MVEEAEKIAALEAGLDQLETVAIAVDGLMANRQLEVVRRTE